MISAEAQRIAEEQAAGDQALLERLVAEGKVLRVGSPEHERAAWVNALHRQVKRTRENVIDRPYTGTGADTIRPRKKKRGKR